MSCTYTAKIVTYKITDLAHCSTHTFVNRSTGDGSMRPLDIVASDHVSCSICSEPDVDFQLVDLADLHNVENDLRD